MIAGSGVPRTSRSQYVCMAGSMTRDSGPPGHEFAAATISHANAWYMGALAAPYAFGERLINDGTHLEAFTSHVLSSRPVSHTEASLQQGLHPSPI
jgi:hypothetical protein